MPKPKLADVAKKMKDIDIAMLVTRSSRGRLVARPMSNNRDVAYEGTSFYFTFEKSGKVKDIEKTPQVALTFAGKKGLYISVTGRAKLIRSRKAFAEHWVPDLERWFEKGIDTPGLVLLQVKAKTITVWDGEDQGEITLR